MTADAHRKTSVNSVKCAVITVGDSRTEENDVSGKLMVEMLQGAGHSIVMRRIVRDEAKQIFNAFLEGVGEGAQVILFTGGTGITSRDVTYETLHPRLSKEITGFGELFRYLSYQEVKGAAMMSRAFAGVIGRSLVFCLPGSPEGVRLAMEKLIVPELGHLVREAFR